MYNRILIVAIPLSLLLISFAVWRSFNSHQETQFTIDSVKKVADSLTIDGTGKRASRLLGVPATFDGGRLRINSQQKGVRFIVLEKRPRSIIVLWQEIIEPQTNEFRNLFGQISNLATLQDGRKRFKAQYKPGNGIVCAVELIESKDNKNGEIKLECFLPVTTSL